MTTLTLTQAQPLEPQDDAAVRWSPVFATLVWSSISALTWSAVIGLGLALT